MVIGVIRDNSDEYKLLKLIEFLIKLLQLLDIGITIHCNIDRSSELVGGRKRARYLCTETGSSIQYHTSIEKYRIAAVDFETKHYYFVQSPFSRTRIIWVPGLAGALWAGQKLQVQTGP